MIISYKWLEIILILKKLRMNNFTLIIPTHNRHHYLARSIEYFKDLKAKVIYCDSTHEVFKGELFDSMEYIHMPGKRFGEKIIFALKKITTDLVVMCADDDFILINALYNGSDYLKNNKSYKTVVGKYIGFNQKFDGKFYPIYQKLPDDIDFGYEMNSEIFFKNYYQILWSMSHKKVITEAFQIINEAKFHNDNFIEFVIGACACYEGGIKFLDQIWGAREQSTLEHWGSQHVPITNMKIANINGDFLKFSDTIDSKTNFGYAKKILTNYLKGQQKQEQTLKRLVNRLIPWKIKKYIKQNILIGKTINNLNPLEDFELEKLRSLLFKNVELVSKKSIQIV